MEVSKDEHEFAIKRCCKGTQRCVEKAFVRGVDKAVMITYFINPPSPLYWHLFIITRFIRANSQEYHPMAGSRSKKLQPKCFSLPQVLYIRCCYDTSLPDIQRF